MYMQVIKSLFAFETKYAYNIYSPNGSVFGALDCHRDIGCRIPVDSVVNEYPLPKSEL